MLKRTCMYVLAFIVVFKKVSIALTRSVYRDDSSKTHKLKISKFLLSKKLNLKLGSSFAQNSTYYNIIVFFTFRPWTWFYVIIRDFTDFFVKDFFLVCLTLLLSRKVS